MCIGVNISGVIICDIRLCVLPPWRVFAFRKHRVVPKSRLTELALILQGAEQMEIKGRDQMLCDNIF